jgi:hypothetical protein
MQGLNNDIEVTATGQAELFGLLGGDTVLKELWSVRCEFTAGKFLKQILFHAAPGQ